MAWGNGFVTDPATIQKYNLSDPSGFFEDIAAVPALANRTLLSAHVYGPNITVRAAAVAGSSQCWVIQSRSCPEPVAAEGCKRTVSVLPSWWTQHAYRISRLSCTTPPLSLHLADAAAAAVAQCSRQERWLLH